MAQGVILHRWPFQESGYIIELFSSSLGRIRAVAKGAKRPKSPWRGRLEPFQLMEFEIAGKGDLKTLTQADVIQTYALKGSFLYSGFYLNELLQRLLPEQYAQPELFDDYLSTLELLSEQVMLEAVLRKFEWRLLEHLNLDFSWQTDASTQQPIKDESVYRFQPEVGFVEVYDHFSPSDFQGQEIKELSQFQFQGEAQLKRYKQLMRWALQPYIGSKPLHSRNLFKPQS